MKTKSDDSYDRLVATHQSLEASLLNTVLKENGILDVERRRKIMGEFLFAQGNCFDQTWIIEDGRRYFPGVFFSSVPHPEIAQAEVLLPGPQYGSNYHEYAWGAADWAIENENGPDRIEFGTE